MIEITDSDRVRTVTLNRPEAKNAMSEALWDATAEAFLSATDNPDVAVVVLTGKGDAFSAGVDLVELAEAVAGTLVRGKHGFPGLADAMIEFPKPVILAVNGVGAGFGATVLGVADLVFMSTSARLKCPFTALGVAPEFASSFTLPSLIGRQNASWMLLSSEWISAQQCLDMGLVFQLCEPEELMATAMKHAHILAAKPISALVESKRTIMEPLREQMRAARRREDAAYQVLLGGPANIEAMTAFAEKRDPDFTGMV